MALDMKAKLAELRREAKREWRAAQKQLTTAITRPRSRRGMARAIAIACVRGAAIVALPFVVYVRAAVFAYNHSAPTWLALIAGAVLTLGVVAGYVAWFARRFKGRVKVERMIRWVALPTAAAWCLYSAIYLARVNAKSDAVHGYYSSVHPILRVALSTVILVNPDLVITDMARTPADYARMGLPINDRTRHYVQRDGWVHAVDLRTRGRGEIANRTIQFYFWIMGFDPIRHVGTADHLHVQLVTR